MCGVVSSAHLGDFESTSRLEDDHFEEMDDYRLLIVLAEWLQPQDRAGHLQLACVGNEDPLYCAWS